MDLGATHEERGHASDADAASKIAACYTRAFGYRLRPDHSTLFRGLVTLPRVVVLALDILLDCAQGMVPHDVVYEFGKQ